MLSLVEKEMAVKNSPEYFDGTEGKLLFKVLTSYLANTTTLQPLLHNIDETIFTDKYRFEKYSKMIIKYMVNVDNDIKTDITYTTGQLSKIFGVSITTINNWIKEERFINLEPKIKNKQSRISENILWKSSNGELIAIKEIAKTYKKRNIKNMPEEEEQKIIMSEISFFEKKYGGSYNATLSKKEDKTDEELRDASEWVYLLNRVTV
nr:hypothetical protein [Sedimentibacter sp.]